MPAASTSWTKDLPRGTSFTLPTHRPGIAQVESGLIALVRTSRAQEEALLYLVGPEETVGDEGLLGGDAMPPHTHLEVLVAARVRWLEAPVTEIANWTLTSAVSAVMAARTRLLHDIACRKRDQTVPQQIAQQLAILSEKAGGALRADGMVDLSTADLARIVGTHRSFASQVCRPLIGRGWIEPVRGAIRVHAVQQLRAYALDGLPAPANQSPDLRRQRLLDAQRTLVHLLVEGHDTVAGPSAAPGIVPQAAGTAIRASR